MDIPLNGHLLAHAFRYPRVHNQHRRSDGSLHLVILDNALVVVLPTRDGENLARLVQHGVSPVILAAHGLERGLVASLERVHEQATPTAVFLRRHADHLALLAAAIHLPAFRPVVLLRLRLAGVQRAARPLLVALLAPRARIVGIPQALFLELLEARQLVALVEVHVHLITAKLVQVLVFLHQRLKKREQAPVYRHVDVILPVVNGSPAALDDGHAIPPVFAVVEGIGIVARHARLVGVTYHGQVVRRPRERYGVRVVRRDVRDVAEEVAAYLQRDVHLLGQVRQYPVYV